MKKEQSLIIKTIAILLLMFHHMSYVPDAILPLSVMSRFCVWLFVFITAYGLTIQYKKNSSIKFVAKRLLLLYIPFWIIYIIDYILVAVKFDLWTYMEKNPINVILDALCLSYYLRTPPITGIFWYIGMIALYIILMPLIYMAVHKFRYWTIIPVVLFVIFFPWKISTDFGGRIDVYLPIFVLGMCLAESEEPKLLNLDIDIKGKLLMFIAGIVVFSVIYYLIFYVIYGISETVLGLFYNILAFVVILIVVNCLRNIPDKGSKVYFIGEHSNNIYFLHITLFQFYIDALIQNPLLRYLCCLIVCLLISVVIELIKKYTGFNKAIKKVIVK